MPDDQDRMDASDRKAAREHVTAALDGAASLVDQVALVPTEPG